MKKAKSATRVRSCPNTQALTASKQASPASLPSAEFAFSTIPLSPRPILRLNHFALLRCPYNFDLANESDW